MLAINGGRPVRERPFPRRALFGAAEKEAALRLFDQAIASGEPIGYGGPEEEAYEKEFAAAHGGGFADLVNSGTSALYAALGGLELEPASEVVVPPISDPGGVMPVALLNLVPVVADAAPGSFNAGAEQVEAVLSPRTRAIIVAHIAGEPAEMDAILELAGRRGVPVIEDCAQAHGARCRGRTAGTLGTLGVFSTMSGKHHATGPQGGVVFTADEALGWRCKRFADRGKPLGLEGASSNVRAGLNLNGNELAAAVGRAQLRRLPEIVARRRGAARSIAAGLESIPAVSCPREPPGDEGVYWFQRVRVDEQGLAVDKEHFARAVAAEGIPVNPSYRFLVAEAEWFRERRVFPPSDYPWGLPEYGGDRKATFPCPNAAAAVESHFSFSIHENWGEGEVADAVEAVRKVAAEYGA